MSDEKFMTVSRNSLPDTRRGQALFVTRGLISSVLSLVFLAGFISIIVGVILTLLTTAAVLVAGLGAVAIGLGLVTMLAFGFAVAFSPHDYTFNTDAME